VSPPGVVYFSSTSGNTHRFVEKLAVPARRIPLYAREEPLRVTDPYVLIVPTYGGGNGAGTVPKQVIRFLNDPDNRALIVGVIGAGNTNFGEHYAAAVDVVAAKCRVPLLYRFELFGTPEDVRRVRDGLDTL
jgi:protein involved in ribonucleotide reduction